jgi:hypothetical protein
MITLRPAGQRGRTHIGWLDSWHSFSFGDYMDADHHHFHALRVINDDRIAGGGGFGTHPHRDMEILTCMLTGTLAHRDSLGHGEQLNPGEWQVMTAGTGIAHSEVNASATEPVHLLQIWLMPDRRGHTPAYAQKRFHGSPGTWTLIASPDARDGSLPIHQDALVSQALLPAGQSMSTALVPSRAYWLHVATGEGVVNGIKVHAGDGVAFENESKLEIAATADSRVILFDLKR